jgi:hypothetical protein
VPTEHNDDDATRAVARLPGLEIAVEHRRSDNAERISIHLQAIPFGDYFEGANPFIVWARAAQLAWLPWLVWSPWLDATRSLLPPRSIETPPTVPEG